MSVGMMDELRALERRLASGIAMVRGVIAEREAASDEPTTGGGIGPNGIVAVVAAHFGVAAAEIAGPRRREGVIPARHVAMYLVRALTPLSLPAIGRVFGHRHHTTVLAACQKVERTPALKAAAAEIALEMGVAL